MLGGQTALPTGVAAASPALAQQPGRGEVSTGGPRMWESDLRGANWLASGAGRPQAQQAQPTQTAGAQSALSPLAQALSEILTGNVSQGVQNRVEQTYQPVAAQAQREFENVTLPRVREAFAGGGGYWGGARAKAEQTAATDLATNLAALRARMQQETIGQATQQQFQAMQLNPQTTALQDPNYAARQAAIQQALTLSGQQQFENIEQPWQNQNVSYQPGAVARQVGAGNLGFQFGQPIVTRNPYLSYF
jgi:hypothetical protein